MAPRLPPRPRPRLRRRRPAEPGRTARSWVPAGFVVAWTHLRLAVLVEVQYRVNFFVQLLQSAVEVGAALAVLALVFGYTGDLGGWSHDELLVVLGLHVLLGGVIETFVQPNMARLMADVREGTFDFALLKPVDAQFLVSCRQLNVWQLMDVVVGAAIVGVGVSRVGSPGPAGVAGFAVAIVCGAFLIYCAWLAVTVGAFWLVRMDFVSELFSGLYQAGRWPVTIYPGWLRVGLTVLVPLAFAVTVPAEALTGRLDGGTLLAAVGFTVLVAVLTRWWWRRGVRRYDGASA
jgi:ABC-2 type transport system permease protein